MTHQNNLIYLPVYLSDWVSEGRKLTMLQRGALVDLSVLYFQENLKISLQKEQIYRLVFAFENSEKDAVDFILKNYFEEVVEKPMGSFWVSKKLNEIGDKVLKRLNANRQNGKLGGRKNNKPMGSFSLNPDDNPDESILNEIKLNEIKLKETKKISNEISLVLNDDFDNFWKHYTPIQDKNGQHIDKGSKSAAKKSYEKARKKFSHEQIMSCLESYLKDCAKNSRFTKHTSSWLNQATADGFEFEQVAVIQSQAPPRKMTKDELQEQASQEFLTRTQENYDNEHNF